MISYTLDHLKLRVFFLPFESCRRRPNSPYILVCHSVTSYSISGYYTPTWRGYLGLSYDPNCFKIRPAVLAQKMNYVFKCGAPRTRTFISASASYGIMWKISGMYLTLIQGFWGTAKWVNLPRRCASQVRKSLSLYTNRMLPQSAKNKKVRKYLLPHDWCTFPHGWRE